MLAEGRPEAVERQPAELAGEDELEEQGDEERGRADAQEAGARRGGGRPRSRGAPRRGRRCAMPRSSWSSDARRAASASVRGRRVATSVDDGLAHLEALTEVDVHRAALPRGKTTAQLGVGSPGRSSRGPRCTSRVQKRAYCTTEGRSSPSCSRMRATSAGRACGPATIRAGSPGRRTLTAKAIDTTAQTTHDAPRERAARAASSAAPRREGAPRSDPARSSQTRVASTARPGAGAEPRTYGWRTT